MKNLNLTYARTLRGIYFIDPEDKEFKVDHQECLQEIGYTSGSRYALQDQQKTIRIGRIVVNPMRQNQNLRVLWKPVNLQDCLMGEAGKGDNSLQHYNLVHKFIPMPQAMKIPASKSSGVDKEWETLEKIPAWDKTKVRNKSEVIDEARTKGAKVHFASLMELLSFEKCQIGDTAPENAKVELYSEGTL